MIHLASEDYAGSGMIALRPSDEVVKIIADMDECTEKFEDLHLTLKYLGDIDEGDLRTKDRYYRGLYDFVLHAGYRGLTGVLNGFGVFENEENSLISLWDIPGIAEFRTSLLSYVKNHAPDIRADNHGFTPHMTLANTPDRIRTLPRIPAGLRDKDVHFVSVWLAWGEEWTEVTLM